MIEAAIDSASSRSSAAAGSGTSITKITLMAPSGSTYSRNRCRMPAARRGAGCRRRCSSDVSIGPLTESEATLSGCACSWRQLDGLACGGSADAPLLAAPLRARRSRISASTRWR